MFLMDNPPFTNDLNNSTIINVEDDDSNSKGQAEEVCALNCETC